MVKKLFQMSELKKARLLLKHSIENALEDLGWDRAVLAKEYGVYMREGTYTRARMSQLVNVNKGQEENSENMLRWMNKQINKVKI